MGITDAMGKEVPYCGNKTGQNHLVTENKVEMTFISDDKVEKRGYYLVFTLVSPPSISPPPLDSQASVSPTSSLPHGKWDHKET